MTCNETVKVKLLKTFCNSFYGCKLWCDSEHNICAYRRIFRKLFHVKNRKFTSIVMIQMHIDPLTVIVRKMLVACIEGCLLAILLAMY